MRDELTPGPWLRLAALLAAAATGAVIVAAAAGQGRAHDLIALVALAPLLALAAAAWLLHSACGGRWRWPWDCSWRRSRWAG